MLDANHNCRPYWRDRTVGNVKTILAALLGAVVMLFALQNMSEVEVTFVV